MLAELKSAHAQIFAILDELDVLAASDAPDEAALANARWRLSRARGARRTLVDAVCAKLIETASPADAARLHTFQEENAAHLRASTEHVSTWGLKQVIADWEGYRVASKSVRKLLRDRAALEQRLLYPMLERAPG